MVTLFGTDGVRGLVNSTLMPELAYQLGRAAGAYFCKTKGEHRFLIGMDTRISGSMLTAALSAGLCASGVNVDVVGVIPTPGVAYLTKTEGYDAGVVISASHNPFPDNGIKFFDRNGYKLPDKTEEEIENILRHDEEIVRPTGEPARIGRMFAAADIVVSAWSGDTLVGLCRALTDFSYCCYLSDLAVDKSYQGRGIGTGLVDRLRAALGDEVAARPRAAGATA